jgi:hypothetical protein
MQSAGKRSHDYAVPHRNCPMAGNRISRLPKVLSNGRMLNQETELTRRLDTNGGYSVVYEVLP